MLKDLLHALVVHSWYYSGRERACVRCGIVQVRTYITNKWKVGY